MGIGKLVFERRADQFVARPAGERLGLLVDVGDDAARIRGNQGIDARFDQRAGVEVLIAQPLVELHPLLFGLLARGIVGADQQITDDRVLRIAQRSDRDHRRKAAAVLTKVRQLVDILNAARSLEHQRLEAGRNRGAQFHAQCRGTRDHFLRIGDVGRGKPVHDFARRIAEHALGADVEDLDHALGVGGDAGEIGAVEDRLLQCSGGQQCVRFARVERGVGLGGCFGYKHSRICSRPPARRRQKYVHSNSLVSGGGHRLCAGVHRKSRAPGAAQ
jgi:hypothetical protein